MKFCQMAQTASRAALGDNYYLLWSGSQGGSPLFRVTTDFSRTVKSDFPYEWSCGMQGAHTRGRPYYGRGIRVPRQKFRQLLSFFLLSRENLAQNLIPSIVGASPCVRPVRHRTIFSLDDSSAQVPKPHLLEQVSLRPPLHSRGLYW